MKRLLFAFAVVLSAFTVACGKTNAELKAVVMKDMKAMQDEDIEAAMSGLATTDPAELAAARATYEALFEAYDITYKLIGFKVISCEGDDAVVEVVQEAQVVKPVTGPVTRTTVETKMKKTASGWKQAGTTIKNAEALESSDSSANVDKKTEAELKAVIMADMKAMEDEDIDAAISGLVINDSDSLAASRKVYEDLFEKFDLSYKLVGFKVISCEGDNAVVEVVEEVRKIRGPAFQNSRTTMETTMKKTSSGWKQVGSKLKKTEAL